VSNSNEEVAEALAHHTMTLFDRWQDEQGYDGEEWSEYIASAKRVTESLKAEFISLENKNNTFFLKYKKDNLTAEVEVNTRDAKVTTTKG